MGSEQSEKSSWELRVYSDIRKIFYIISLTLEYPNFSNIAFPNIAFVCSPRCRDCFRSVEHFPIFCARVPLLCLSDTFIHYHIDNVLIMICMSISLYIHEASRVLLYWKFFKRRSLRFCFLYFKEIRLNTIVIFYFI